MDYRQRLENAVQAFIDATNALEDLAYENGDEWNELVDSGSYPFDRCFHEVAYDIRDMSVREAEDDQEKHWS